MSLNVIVCMGRVMDIAVESGDPSSNSESKIVLHSLSHKCPWKGMNLS